MRCPRPVGVFWRIFNLMAEAITRNFGDQIGGIDAQLLAAREMGKEKRAKQRGEESTPQPEANAVNVRDIPAEKSYVSGRQKTRREKTRAERARQQLRLAGKQVVRHGTKEFAKSVLRKSWYGAFTGIGFIVLVLVANLIVFLRWVFGPDKFPRLGEEWDSLPLQQATGGAGSVASRGLGVVEVMGLLLIDAAVITLAVLLLTLLVIIITFLSKSWLGQIWALTRAVYYLGFDGLAALVSLFSGLL